MKIPEIDLKDLLELPELADVVVVELGQRWDGVVSGKVRHNGTIKTFQWIMDDVKDDLVEGRDYVVYDDNVKIHGRITEDVVNSFRTLTETETGSYYNWELKANLETPLMETEG